MSSQAEKARAGVLAAAVGGLQPGTANLLASLTKCLTPQAGGSSQNRQAGRQKEQEGELSRKTARWGHGIFFLTALTQKLRRLAELAFRVPAERGHWAGSKGPPFAHDSQEIVRSICWPPPVTVQPPPLPSVQLAVAPEQVNV